MWSWQPMTAVLLVPAVLSILLLAAHFLRAGQALIVLLLLGLLPLLLLRRRWSVRLVQAVLVLGALEWLWTLLELARLRAAVGEPYGRMALILGAVALVTAASALLFEMHRLRPQRR